jgi:histone H3/H4
MSRSLNIRAHEATEKIFDILGLRPSGDQGELVAQAIEQVIVKALEKSVERSMHAATKFLATDRRIGDEIAEEIRRAHEALISNLSSMR